MRIEQFISGEAVDRLGDALLLVGTDGAVLDANAVALDSYGYSPADMMRLNIRDILAPPKVGARRPAVQQDAEDGVPFESEHRRSDGTAFPVEVRLASVSVEGEIARVYAVRDITERKRAETAQQNLMSSVIAVISSVSESRDPYTTGHEQRVSELVTAIARDMGLPESQVAEICLAALIHDVGKVSVPAEILSVAGQLSNLEFEIVKDHAEAGYQILCAAKMDSPITELVYQHHERCDGSGYPRGLTSDQILEGAKILMVADVVEAMSSHRPHRPAPGIERALLEIEGGAGKRYDSRVAESCVRVFREQGFAFTEV